MGIKTWDVWHDDESKWVKYTEEELKEFFKFVNPVDWNNVDEVYLNNSGFQTWLRLVYKNCNGYSKDFNNVHGIYVEI